jgi:hypothetical protein
MADSATAKLVASSPSSQPSSSGTANFRTEEIRGGCSGSPWAASCSI